MENIETANYTLLLPADGVTLVDGVLDISVIVRFVAGERIGEFEGLYSSFSCCVALCSSCSSRSCLIISS